MQVVHISNESIFILINDEVQRFHLHTKNDFLIHKGNLRLFDTTSKIECKDIQDQINNINREKLKQAIVNHNNFKQHKS
jgi:flavorubredoxin